MDKPNPTNDYHNGQMMGMLVIIRALKLKGTIPANLIDNIEHSTSGSLAEYFQQPEEDVLLLVDTELQKITGL